MSEAEVGIFNFHRLFQLQTISCKLCNTKSKVLLWKKPQISKKISEEENVATNETKTVEKKLPDKLLLEPDCNKNPKKKRKRDKNAGLLYAVNKDDNSVKAVTNVKLKFDKLNIQKAASTSSNQNIKKHQIHNKGKSNATKQSKVNVKNTPKKGVKSLPQRNNLLQLANALKAKGNPSGSNSQADKLKQLLR